MYWILWRNIILSSMEMKNEDISHLPTGIYFVSVGYKKVKIIKK